MVMTEEASFLVKEALRGAERHEDAAIFKAVGGLQNSDDVKDSMTDGHMIAEFCAEELRGSLSENHIVGVLRESCSDRPQSTRPCECARRQQSRQSR